MLCPCSGQVVRSKPPGTACRAPTGRNTLPTTDSLPEVPLGILDRLRVCLGLLSGLRRHDFRAARTWIRMMYAGRHSFPVAIVKFSGWAVRQMLGEIPQAMQHTTWARTVSKTPSWLAQGNPLENHPWQLRPDAHLPEAADAVVIGAGFTGGALAYHWSKRAPAESKLVVLEMDDAASGSSGRNEGLVVMGRFYRYVYKTVIQHLDVTLRDHSIADRQAMARQFAAAYVRAAYRNADLIEQTIREEGFDCDYVRAGWVQAQGAAQQADLATSVRLAVETGFTDWTEITPDEVYRKTGMRVQCKAGFSIAAASFHPAKWVWSLLSRAIESGKVELYSRTKVLAVEDEGETYSVRTDRGDLRARHVVNATESYTPLLHPQFHNLIRPTQTQAASGEGGPPAMKPHIGISGHQGFFGRYGSSVMVGSDATRVPDREAGRIQPSRFITKFLIAQMREGFGPSRYHVTNEWSGTVSYTPDEYPIVGVMDGKRQYIIGGLAGSGTGVSFNAGRCVVNRILGNRDEEDDYPPEYFSPTRLLDPKSHRWPG